MFGNIGLGKLYLICVAINFFLGFGLPYLGYWGLILLSKIFPKKIERPEYGPFDTAGCVCDIMFVASLLGPITIVLMILGAIITPFLMLHDWIKNRNEDESDK